MARVRHRSAPAGQAQDAAMACSMQGVPPGSTERPHRTIQRKGKRMNTILRNVAAACSIAIAAAACASSIPRAERLATYQSFAGEPVKQIRYFSPQGWEEVDDDHILLSMRPTEVYLVRLSGPCLQYDNGAVAMAVTNTGGWIQNKFDYISFGTGMRCRIEE